MPWNIRVFIVQNLLLLLGIASNALFAADASSNVSKVTLVDSRAFQATNNDKFGKMLEYIEGQEIGLTNGFEYGIRDYTDPFWIGRGTAAGDYNQDGWQDVIFGSNEGFFLYQNEQGKFKLQAQSNNAINQFRVYAVAFIDINNDSWLDIFFTTFNNGNYFILNKQGTFDFSHLIPVPNQNAVLTLSPAFADIDFNGQLDVINGNIGLGVVTGMHHMQARRNNSLVFTQNLEFRDVALESVSGETMASLVSDINNDGIQDIYFGNDFIIPDKILLGTGKGFEAVTGNKFIPYTPFFSMGADTGDIDNDLNLDFLITGTMYMAPFVGKTPIDGVSVDDYSAFKGGVDTCESIKNVAVKKRCRSVRTTGYIDSLDTVLAPLSQDCQKVSDPMKKQICLTQLMWQLITEQKKITSCDPVYSQDKTLREVCEILLLKERRYDKRDLYGAIPQDDRNMLYRFNPQKKAFDMVEGFRHPGGWTWNSRIVDIDNDGWQDIVTSDGTVRKQDYGWNVLMRNIDGKQFEQIQFSQGFVNDFGLYSYSLVDMDNDGDLDIIGNSAEGPVQVYRNLAGSKRHRLAVRLRDKRGNYYGVGAKITIAFDNGKKAQMREIKLSGGYQSFDPSIAYFGLGDVTSIDSVSIRWIDGEVSQLIGPYKTDQLLVFSRE